MWSRFTLALGHAGGMTATSREPGHLEVWWVAADGSVQAAYWYEGEPWRTYQLAPAGSAAPGSPITAVSRIPQHMEVWWVGWDGSVRGAYWYDGDDWRTYQLAGPGRASATAGIAAVSRVPGHMEVWWVGWDRSVQAAYWYEGTGQPWQPYQLAGPGAAAPTTGIAAISRIPGHQETWWIGADGSVQGAYWYEGTGQPWQPYQLAGPGAAAPTTGIAAISRIPGHQETWWIGADGSVQGAYWYENTGQPWQPYQLAGPGAAAPTTGIAAISRIPGHQETWWIGADGSVQGAYWYENTGQPWQRYQLAGPGAASPAAGVAAVSRAANAMEVWWGDGARTSIQDAHWAGPVSPPDPLDPVRFRLLRVDDLVDLACEAYGCVVDTRQDATPATTHRVVPGETLRGLAQGFYGDPGLFTLIAAANHLADPNLIVAGQVLIIPPPPQPADRQTPRLLAVTDNAHLTVRFGVQHLLEESTIVTVPPTDPPAVAQARAAGDSRVVFNLPAGAGMEFTVAGVLGALRTLALRVPPLALPRLAPGDTRSAEASRQPTAPMPDRTAIEAPYRLIVSPHAGSAFTHAAEATTAPDDTSRVELWHSRLTVRLTDNQGAFLGVDDRDDEHRTVRAVWTRDDDKDATPAPKFTPNKTVASLTDLDRRAIVRQSADPTVASTKTGKPIEPEPLSVDRLYLSALGAWIDWRVGWALSGEYPDLALSEEYPNLGSDSPRSAYTHLAPMGRDAYVRVETPVYLFPFGHRGTLVRLTERKIALGTPDPAANLFSRIFIVLREHTRHYDDTVTRRMPFTEVTIDPVVTPTLDWVDQPSPAFVPKVGTVNFQWKVTGIDHAGRRVTMTTPLVVVPQGKGATAQQSWNSIAGVAVGGAEVAFAPHTTPGDTTARAQRIVFSGVAETLTSTPSMDSALVRIPALSALNHGGEPIEVKYEDDYATNGFATGGKAEIFLVLTQETRLDFTGGSDRGGGFVAPSVAVNALSRKLGAVGDKGATSDPNSGIKDGRFNPAAFLGGALPRLFGLFDLKEILQPDLLDRAPKLITEQLDFISSIDSEYRKLTDALSNARATINDDLQSLTAPGAKAPLQQLQVQVQSAIGVLAANPVQALLDIFRQGPPSNGDNPAAAPADAILAALGQVETLRQNPALPAYLRALVDRPYHALQGALQTALDAAKWAAALTAAVDSGIVRYEWNPTITGWPAGNPVFKPGDPHGLAIAVQVRTSKHGDPQSDVSAQLRNFSLELLPGEPLLRVKFARMGFRAATGAKPEVDVQFDGIEFLGMLGFVDKLRQLIPFDGFADPPYIDASSTAVTAGFNLALPSVAVGVFSLENIAFSADCRVPFLGEAITVGFGFCSKDSPFRLTVMAIGGGGWLGIRLAPNGLVLLEMGLEAGASLSLDFGVASGSVSVVIGVYLRLEDKKGQLTAYYRVRGEVEVLGIASASITLELSLRYDFDSGKLVGRASLRVEVEVLFFSASVEITCERKLAGSKGDPDLAQIMPPGPVGQALWDQYFSSFAIGG